MEKTVLIIGGTGFFGKCILESFINGKLEKFHIKKIIINSRNSSNFKKKYPQLINNQVSFFDADISNANYIPDSDYVIHAATSTNKNDYILDENKELLNIQRGAKNFVNIIKGKSKNIKILYCSSGAVYGQQNKNEYKISENFTFKPIDSLEKEKRMYAYGKRLAEKQIKKLSRLGYDCIIARCFAFEGKYLPRDQHFAYGNFVRMAENGEDIIVKARNRVYRSYMKADDLVLTLFILLIAANEKISIYNVGSSKEILIHDLAEKIAKTYGVNVIRNVIDENLAHDRYIPDVSKLKSLIKNFFPQLQLKTL